MKSIKSDVCSIQSKYGSTIREIDPVWRIDDRFHCKQTLLILHACQVATVRWENMEGGEAVLGTRSRTFFFRFFLFCLSLLACCLLSCDGPIRDPSRSACQLFYSTGRNIAPEP